MNCLDYRRLKLTNPRGIADEARGHARECPSCEAFGQSVDAAEVELARALLVPVPEGLSDRILRARRRARRTSLITALALAATLVMSLGTALHFWHAGGADALAEAAIAHVLEEPQTFASTRPLDPSRLVEAVGRLGGRVESEPGVITHFSICFIGDQLGWHVVLHTPSGMATVLLMPGTPRRGISNVARAGWNVVSEPAARGNVVVVADSAGIASDVAQALRTHIRWRG